MEILIMKKYTCFALLAFFGAAMLSPVMAAPPAEGTGGQPINEQDGEKKAPKEKAPEGH